MKTSQSFVFYPTDFVMGTALLSASEVGAYIRLLCYQWQEGSLPNDETVLARLAQCELADIRGILSKFQTGPDGKLRNKRMEEVRKELISSRKRRSNAGKQGGRPRKAMLSSSLSDEKAIQSSPSPSPSPSPSAVSDEDWLKSLQSDIAYKGINVQAEYSKMVNWCRANNKQPSRRRFINWLNRVEKPMQAPVPRNPGFIPGGLL